MLRRRFAALALGGLVAVVLTACQVDGQVNITVEDDGSGVVEVVVTLDEEAAGRIPELADQLETGDLEERGWTVTGPAPVADAPAFGQPDDDSPVGPVQITATKPFASPEQLSAVLDEVGGAEGLLSGFTLTRTHTFAQVEHELTGTLDVSDKLRSLSDEQLTELLGGQPLGFNLEQLEEELGAPPASMVDLSLSVTLPGEEVEAAPPGEVAGRTATWSAGFESGAAVPVQATSTTDDDTSRVLVQVAAGALVLLVLLLLFRLVRRWRRRRRERRPGLSGRERPAAQSDDDG